MSKLRVGMIDLDTSHPGNWLPIIRDLGHDVVAVYDSGTVHPAGYAEKFASEHGIAEVFDKLEAMAECVDLAIIHSCNWDVHMERATPFVLARKGILIDKPISGNLIDLLQMQEWQEQGIKVSGGSSLRYCGEVTTWLKTHNPADVICAHTGCSTDDFNYGIHAYTLLHGLLGAGIESVRYLGTKVQHLIEIRWTDGREGIIGVGNTTGYLPFYATLITQTDVSHFQVDNTKLYRPFLEQVLPYYAGETENIIPMSELIEVELAAIAAKLSRESDGKRVFLRDIRVDDIGYDGERFAREYKIQRMH